MGPKEQSGYPPEFKTTTDNELVGLLGTTIILPSASSACCYVHHDCYYDGCED